MSLGLGLLSSMHYDDPMSYVLGYQVPAGVGLGFALQQTVLAAQTILPLAQIPIGVSLMVLAQTLGGTIALSAADTIFTTSLSSSLAESVPQVNQATVLSSGATNLQKLVPADSLNEVLKLYNQAVVKTWYLSLALACASIIGTAGMEWKRMKPAQEGAKDSGEGLQADNGEVKDREEEDAEKAADPHS